MSSYKTEYGVYLGRQIMFGKGILVIVIVLAMFWPGNVEATLNWDIYEDAVVSNGEAYNVVSVYDTPPERTMVSVLGGYIDVMRFYDTSTGNVAGGNISSLGALGHSTVNISGVVEIGSAGANDFGTVNVSAGSLHSAGASGKGLLNVSDAANIWMVSFFGGGTMNMVGGEIARVQVFDSSIVNLRGGIIGEGISTRAGDFEGSINVYGYGLAKTNSGGKYGVGQVYGFYPNGSEFVIDLGGGIYPYVNLIPEPATVLFLLSGAFMLRKRRQYGSFGKDRKGMAAKKWTLALLCVSLLSASSALAKSVFIISKHAVPSQAQAYGIVGEQVTRQGQVEIDTYNPGVGAVGNAVWSERKLMFVTYENSRMIVWSSTKDLRRVGEFDTGVTNLAGILVDETNERIYVVRRETDDLYIYSYDEASNSLILQQQANLTLPYPGEYVTAWGIALDEENALLYVSNANEYVDVFRTSDWSHDHYIEIEVNGTPRAAIGIAVDPAHGYLYTGAYNPYEGGTSHNYLVRTETSNPFASIEEDIQKRVIGIGVDQGTGLVYCTTEHNDFRVYQSTLGDPTDIETADISGPAGVAVPRGDVSYKPDVFALSKVDNVVGCVSPPDQFTYNISYSANGHADTGVVITDYLPLEVTYISSLPIGAYDEATHTVTWDLRDISGSASGTLQIVVEVNYLARVGMTITNAVEMEGALYYSRRTEDTGICCWYGGQKIYVDQDATGYENGTSWDNAYTDLQDALEHVERCPGAVTAIWVAAGTYKPTQSPSETSATFELIDGLDMYGHFEGIGRRETSIDERDFENADNETRLDGQIGASPSSGVQYVVTAKHITDLIFDGFTVRGSYGGAGILIEDCPNADLRILRCKVEDNDQYGIESTAAALSVSHFELQDSFITANTIYGLQCERTWARITGTVFDGDNQTQLGIAPYISAVDMFDSEAKNHTGAGIEARDADLVMEDCTVKDNSGAGVACVSFCYVDIDRSVIRSNGWDGIYLENSMETRITNNWIYDNIGIGPYDFFAGIYLSGAIDQAQIRNNTVCSNNTHGIYLESGTEPEVVSCIVYDNTAQIGTASGDPLELVSYSCVEGGYAGTDNISDAPLFLNAGAGDYHLTWYSPCVDEGKPDSTEEGETDIDGNPRVMGGRVDMGADEDFPHCDPNYPDWVSVGRPDCWCYPRQCHGDADGLKQGSAALGYMYVGTDDLAVLVDAWKILEPPKGPGVSGNQICADFDHLKQGSAALGYMRVGTDDLAILIAHWKVLEPPKGPGVPGDCLSCDRGGESGSSSRGRSELSRMDMLDWLAEIWLDPDVQKSIDEEKFLKFYESLKELSNQ